MVLVVSDPGCKYKQTTSLHTPAYVVDGVRMEDAARVVSTRTATIICVADGHGSTPIADGVVVGGRECADAACEAVDPQFVDPDRVFAACHDAIRTRVFFPGLHWDAGVARVVTERSAGGTELATHGCTLSVCRIEVGRPSWFAWVGDSVGVLVRGNGDVVRLGVPHSAHNLDEAKRMRDAGVSTDGKYFEYYVRGSKMRIAVSRSLGHFNHDAMLATPEVVRFVPRAGDRIVVASDGLWDAVAVERAAGVVGASDSEEVACAALMAIYRQGSSPRDNVVIACHFVCANEASETTCCLVS